MGLHRVGHGGSDVARTHARKIMWIFLHVGGRGTLPVTPLVSQTHPREEASPMLVKTPIHSDRKLSPRAARYLLQPDLLRLEDVQHPAALNLRKILPEVESWVGVAEQADLGQGLPLGWACWFLLLLPVIFLWSLLAGRAPISTALYLCILLPPGLNLLESWFISVFLIQEPWNQIKPFWRHDRDFRYGVFQITKSSFRLLKAKKSKCQSLSPVQVFVTPWTVACQAPLSLGFSRQEYWKGLPVPSPGDLPDPRTEPRSPAWQADTLPSEPWGIKGKCFAYENTKKPDPHRSQGRATERTATVFISWEGSVRISLFFFF